MNNDSNATTVGYLSVDGTDLTVSGRGNYDLTLAYGAIAATDTCSNAETFALDAGVLPDGGAALTAATSNGFDGGLAHDYLVPAALGCFSYSGTERVYAITLAAGQSVLALGDTTGDIVMDLVSAGNCHDAPACLSGWDDPDDSSSPARVAYTNSGTAPETVYLLVAPFTSTTFPNYNLRVFVSPP